MHQKLPRHDHNNNGNTDYGTDDPCPIYLILLLHRPTIAHGIQLLRRGPKTALRLNGRPELR